MLATVLARIYPSTKQEGDRIWLSFRDNVDRLLVNGMSTSLYVLCVNANVLKTFYAGSRVVDNTEPIHNAFSLGFHLAFHTKNNKVLKTKLATVYSLYCPALLTGDITGASRTGRSVWLKLHVRKSFISSNTAAALTPSGTQTNYAWKKAGPRSRSAKIFSSTKTKRKAVAINSLK